MTILNAFAQYAWGRSTKLILYSVFVAVVVAIIFIFIVVFTFLLVLLLMLLLQWVSSVRVFSQFVLRHNLHVQWSDYTCKINDPSNKSQFSLRRTENGANEKKWE